MPTALVTGALGGIGQEICKALTAAGYTVIGTDITTGECPGAAHFVPCNLADFSQNPDATNDFLKQVRELLGGGLNVLVNNAAMLRQLRVDQVSVADWNLTIAVNLSAAFFLTQAFLPELEAVKGSVVNISSIHANQTKWGFAAYAASKGGLVSLTRALAVELGAKGVRVNAILPAAIETPMLLVGFVDNPEGYAQLADYHPIKRVGQPAEVAGLVVYLASSQAGFVTGSAITIDGAISGRLHDPD